MEQTNPHRLPTTVLPSRYAVTLRPDIPAASFAGQVSITATASESTTSIVMNAIELDIHSANALINAGHAFLLVCGPNFIVRRPTYKVGFVRTAVIQLSNHAQKLTDAVR